MKLRLAVVAMAMAAGMLFGACNSFSGNGGSGTGGSASGGTGGGKGELAAAGQEGLRRRRSGRGMRERDGLRRAWSEPGPCRRRA